MKPDARVQFPQSAAPVDETLAKAVIELANAFCKGDSAKIASMIDAATKQSLDVLTGDGRWDDEVAKIEAVRVVNITDLNPPTDASNPAMSTANVYLAIQKPGVAHVQGWIANKAGDKWVFTATPCTRTTKHRASDFDSDSATTLAGVDIPAAPSSGGEPGKDSTPGAPQAPAATPGDTTPAPSGPPVKRTPNGPVTIPGSG